MIGNATQNPGAGGWKSQIASAIRRDPRRTWLLVLLVVILAALWGKMLLGAHLPTQAIADSLAPAALSGADATSPDSAPQPNTERSLRQWAKLPSPPLDRDLFSVPFEYYSQDPAHPPKLNHSDDQQAKSAATQADQLRERQNLAENLRTAAANLTLEGTVLGANPRAWVNGLLVGIGQPIGDSGFRIAKIESRRVFIERDGVQIELSMK